MTVDAVLLARSDDPHAVPLARRATRKALAAGPYESLADDASLVVTELVTNALLHTGAPATVRMLPQGTVLRIEVRDRSQEMPVLGQAGNESMTGRGLALVDELSSRWGIDRLDNGKVVWCELRLDGAGRDDSARGSVQAQVPAQQRPTYTVHMGGVPTDLVLAAKAHIENLVRELLLMRVGSHAGRGSSLPPRLEEVVGVLVRSFVQGRAAITRQARSAAAEGRERTDLVVTLPRDEVPMAELYLAALDEADAYARTGLLLTLDTPPQQRVFRRWYVEALVAHDRAHRAGEPAPAVPTFEQRLLDELGVVAAAQRTAERSARLQKVTAALAAAMTWADAARIVVAEGVGALRAAGGALLMRSADGDLLELTGIVGYDRELSARIRRERPEDVLPATQALRTGEPVWVRTPHERDLRFPALLDIEPGTAAVCALPLEIQGQVAGVIRLSFDEVQVFDEDDRTFLLALAAQTSLAMERAALHRAEKEARSSAEALAHRLERLQWVTADISGAVEIGQVADIVVTHLADVLGAVVTTLSLVDGDMLKMLRSHGLEEESEQRWSAYSVTADLPASEAVREQRVVVIPDLVDVVQRYPLMRGAGRYIGSVVCLPLIVGRRPLGVVTLRFATPREVDADDVPFLELLAHTCAQALDRARALTQAREASEKLALLADASAELADVREYHDALGRIARLLVPRLADWCVITIREGGVLRPVTIAHADPERMSWARQYMDRMQTHDVDATGAGAVVRTGVSELYETITPDMLAEHPMDEGVREIVQGLSISSGLVVPLTGRTGTFGAIQMYYTESGRRYGYADRALVEDLARRAAAAVENARAFELQKAQLASISRVAEVAQHAILAPVQERMGPVRLAGAYVSASRDALIGGDHYEVVPWRGGVRVFIGDVRGKGLEAVRLATVVLGLFRAAAIDHDDLADVACQVDQRLDTYLGYEDFVTAVLVDIAADGRCHLVSCGHPPPLLATGGQLREVEVVPSLPLGLGTDPVSTSVDLSPGDRLLLYTDGLIESRDRVTGEFLDLHEVAAPLADHGITSVLGSILDRVQDAAGQRLNDDLAMLVLQFSPEQPFGPERPFGPEQP